MVDSTPLVSIISPVYRAESILPELVSRIEHAMNQVTSQFEIILVDDRSPDGSWEVMKGISSQKKFVRSIRLSRNFGQHYAITAGLDHARGEWIIVMDCDLQDRPEEIPKLYAKALEGFDGVLARRTLRRDYFIKRFFSRAFYRTLGYLTGTRHDETVANFGIYHRKVIDQVRRLRESIRYFPTMVQWVGFNITRIDVEHAPRSEGKSNYNLRKLLLLALDIILAYSDRPIRLVIKLGLFIAMVSLLFIGVTLYKWLSGDIEVLGYASLIISTWFLSGCLLVTLGVVGLYVGKTFEGVKQRPIYIIDESV
jgi:dolichol-phosphate mannosyltransferase